MYRAIKLAIVTLIAVISQTTWADNKISNMTGLQLRDVCVAGLKPRPRVASTDTLVKLATNVATCTNYVAATNDGIQLMLGLINSQIIDSNNKKNNNNNNNNNCNNTYMDLIKKPYCIPDSASDEDKINKILNFIAEEDSAYTAPASSVIHDAFVKYYPCR